MEYDYSELRGKIRARFGSETALAAAIGMNRSTFSQKINNLLEFTQQDMIQIIVALGEPRTAVGTLFFTPKVTKTKLEA